MDRDGKSTEEAIAVEPSPEAPGIKLGILDNYIAFHLRLAQNASFKSFKRHSGESSLRPGWFAVLVLIHNNPGITPMALSRASGRDKSTLTPVLRDLLRHKLISRRTMPKDRRSYTLYLTAAGQKKLGQLSAHAAEHERALDEIVGDRKDEFIDLLRRMATILD